MLPCQDRGAPRLRPAPRGPHLHVEPLLHIPVVALHHGLVLTPHLLQHPVQVHGGRSIHLNVKAVPKLAAEHPDLLKGQVGGHENPKSPLHQAKEPLMLVLSTLCGPGVSLLRLDTL